MKNTILMLLGLTALFISSCDKEEDEVVVNTCDTCNYDVLQYTNEQIKTIVYNGPVFPDNFVIYDTSGTGGTYFSFFDDAGFINEPAAKDTAEARQLIMDNLSYYESGLGEPIFLTGTDKYFEYTFYKNSTSGHRIHKSSYFEGVKFSWSDYSRNQIVEIGKINVKTIDETVIEELFNTLWCNREYRDKGSAVLQQGTCRQSKDVYKYTMFYTNTNGGDYGMYDEISVYKSVFLINKKTRSVSVEYTLVDKFNGNYNPNTFPTPN